MVMKFKSARNQGGLVNYMQRHNTMGIIREGTLESVGWTYCVPVSDLLYAVGVSHVEYMTLDVQGAELSILNTIDFQSLKIDIIIVEAALNDQRTKLRELFSSTGLYKEVAFLFGNDLMFERIDLE